jgi:hypothetical protein
MMSSAVDRSRRGRSAVLGVLVACLMVVTACDLPAGGGSHSANINYKGCPGQLTHSHYPPSAGNFWFSTTSANTSDPDCLGGVASRLEYRWTDGHIYWNSWIWGTNVISSVNEGAAASPRAFHIVCHLSSDCKNYEN